MGVLHLHGDVEWMSMQGDRKVSDVDCADEWLYIGCSESALWLRVRLIIGTAPACR